MTEATLSRVQSVYLVDDDDAFRGSLQPLLEAEGFVVRPFSSAENFLQHLGDDAEVDGVLLLDVRMPGMGGLQLQEILCERGITAPVIFLTGHGDVPMAVRAMKTGAREFLEKPFRTHTLLEQIQQAITHHEAGRSMREQQRQCAQRLSRLTRREREILKLVVEGKTSKEIGRVLGISDKTVALHRAHFMTKSGAGSVAEVVRLAIDSGQYRA